MAGSPRLEFRDVCKRFFLDWGLRLVRENDAGLDFESLNGCEVDICKAYDPSLPRATESGPEIGRASCRERVSKQV